MFHLRLLYRVLIPLTKALDKVKTSLVAELFGVICFEIKGKINLSCPLVLLQNLIKSHQPFCQDNYHLGNSRGEDILPSTNKIFLKGIYEVNTKRPYYHCSISAELGLCKKAQKSSDLVFYTT